MTEEELAEQFAEHLAERVAAHLAAMAGGFPSAEDVALIRDHISPNGVAYQNGVRAGRKKAMEDARDAWNALGTDGILELFDKEQV